MTGLASYRISPATAFSALACGLLAVLIYLTVSNHRTRVTPETIREIVAEATRPPAPPTIVSHPEATKETINAIRGGGYVLFMRHAARATSPNLNMYDVSDAVAGLQDINMKAAGYCLSDLGKTDAEIIGHQLRYLGVKVDEVFTSPTCRTRETAERAFGTIGRIDPLLSHIHFKFADAAGKAGVQRNLHEIAKRASAGKNVAIVAHGDYLRHVNIPDQTLKEGGIFVLKLQGDKLELVADLNPGVIARLVYDTSTTH